MRARAGNEVLLGILAITITAVIASACSSSNATTDGGAGGAGGATTITLPGAGGDGGLVIVPALGGIACSVDPQGMPGLVCFGADPYPYQKYLLPTDAGLAPGECPSLGDFPPPPGEDACGNYECGPLLPSAAAGLLQQGDANVDASMDACCFLIYYACQG
jgi:hypothetical protein